MPSVEEEYVSDRTPKLILSLCFNRDLLAVCQFLGKLLRSLSVVLILLRRVDAVEPNSLGFPLVQ
jgi:hypothetical protein